ncbi:ABC transporter ATP-binding protein [Streptomyces griseiscabiei]|uniref:ATP-binding cassette domain-containing protein n=1 Tax=Streptomyces griseiscabiei TaxID=2993540 RepID=A0ABU4L303_9ACTN|nr:ATP-binding cassette domain-containing protein [Streptomyces griseiscabiei]MBZ3901489.1 ABC transporter ATP-binding protein [Streptomyces griseiscabiei]MDX2909961.1 ATP-binding cassette domain-containing protein [Streptomyces griseiscabiei]
MTSAPTMARDAGPALVVERLRKEFPARSRGGRTVVAVDDVSFTLERGGSLAVVGESGSGKTTTARIVAGLEQPTGGTVTVAGNPPGGKRAARTVQMVFQDPFASLDPRQRIGAGLAELLRACFGLGRAAARERVGRLLTDVGLDEQHAARLPRDLSGGQRQRVAIARALALEPEVLILDEAVAALDVSVQAQVLNLLSDIRERTPVSFLFVSHDLAVVRQVTDHCLVMHHGRVVEQGPTADVLDHPQDSYTQELLDAVPKPGWQPRRRRA